VHANGVRLHRTAVLLTGGDTHLAEDLLQTTYARLFASWRRVSSAGNPVGYARTTLTNVFLSHRRVRRNAEIPTGALPEEASYDVALEGRIDLAAALGRLAPTDRAVVVLRYWEDRTVAETAAQLGLSELAVRSRASRALVRLRPHITPTTKEIR
jgi:RNA polymerase sigma-70 factor (sigma-E family)